MADSSITVTFVTQTSEDAEENNQSIHVELDDEKNLEVYGEEKSQFLYGEKAYFRIYKYPDSLAISLTQSDGTLTNEGSGTSETSENISFTNTNEGSAAKPVNQITGSSWLGKSLGAVSAVGTTVSASQTGVGVLKLEYTSNFTRHAISVEQKTEDEYPVIVFISGE